MTEDVEPVSEKCCKLNGIIEYSSRKINQIARHSFYVALFGFVHQLMLIIYNRRRRLHRHRLTPHTHVSRAYLSIKCLSMLAFACRALKYNLNNLKFQHNIRWTRRNKIYSSSKSNSQIYDNAELQRQTGGNEKEKSGPKAERTRAGFQIASSALHNGKWKYISKQGNRGEISWHDLHDLRAFNIKYMLPALGARPTRVK